MSKLDRIDWNLLPALDALLRERNVGRAARRLNTSQPTASGMLARLRRHFDDELLVRHGNVYSLTPFAESLVPLVQELVTSSRTIFDRAGQFDPETSSREFTLASTEYGQLVLGPTLLRMQHAEAPEVRLAFVNPFIGPGSDRGDALLATDGWLGPREGRAGTEARASGLLADRWMCVVDAHHPTVGDSLSLEDAASLAWVGSTVPGREKLIRIGAMRSAGLEPQVEVTTDSFAAVPFLVAGTERLGLLQRGIGRVMAGPAGVRLLECPWTMPPLNLTLWWHHGREFDPAHVWLRDLVSRAMEDVAQHAS